MTTKELALRTEVETVNAEVVPVWLTTLDDLFINWVSVTEQIKEHLASVTDEMALAVGYQGVEDLLSQRYASKLHPSEWKAARKLGFSQSAAGALTGTTGKAIERREAKERQVDQATPSGGEKDQQDQDQGVEDGHGPTCEVFNHWEALAHALLSFGKHHEERAPSPSEIKTINTRLKRAVKIMEEYGS